MSTTQYFTPEYFNNHLIKLLFTIGLISILSPSLAQSVSIKGGLNFSTNLIKEGDLNFSDEGFLKVIPGFHAGILIELPVSGPLSLESGLMVNSKGTELSIDIPSLGIDVSNTTKLLYLDFPIRAKYNTELNKNLSLFVSLGMYAGLGMSGMQEIKDNSGVQEPRSISIDVEWGSQADSEQLKRLDYGISSAVGLVYKRIIFGIAGDYGLANLSNMNEFIRRNRVWRISVGYRFLE